jgi:hypothetical protein
VPGDVLATIYARVNARLRDEQIPEVQYVVFSWRMARAIQYRMTCRYYSISTQLNNSKPRATAATAPAAESS